MRRFLIGATLGALIMYVYIHQAGEWLKSASQWIGGTASRYRGDGMHEKAKDVLK